MKRTLFATIAMTSAAMGTGHAAEPESSRTARFSDVGWTDITSTTATASDILDVLGYRPDGGLSARGRSPVGIRRETLRQREASW